MQITAPVQFISALHHVFEQADPGPARPAAARITAKALADGWITPSEIENLMLATDHRLWQITPREMLRVFEIPMQSVFERPTRGARDAEGLLRVSVVDLARLLILLERSGMVVDPMPLCMALAPTLGAKRLLTAPELMVFWRAQGRPQEPIQFSTPDTVIESAGHVCTTTAGYSVHGYYESHPESDQGEARPVVSMLIVSPPGASERRAAPMPARPALPHLRKYLGQPEGVPIWGFGR